MALSTKTKSSLILTVKTNLKDNCHVNIFDNNVFFYLII